MLCKYLPWIPPGSTRRPVYALVVIFSDGCVSDVYTKRLEIKTYSMLESVMNDIVCISPGVTNMIAYTDLA